MKEFMRDFVVLKSIYTISLALFFPNTINTAIANKAKKSDIIYRGKKPQEIILCMTLRTERNAGRQTRRILSSSQLKNKDLTGSLHFFIWSHFRFAGRFMVYYTWITAIEIIFLKKHWIQKREWLEITLTIFLLNTLWCQGKPTSQFTIQTNKTHLHRHLYSGSAKKELVFLSSLLTCFTRNMKTQVVQKLGSVHLHPDIFLGRRNATEMELIQPNHNLHFSL